MGDFATLFRQLVELGPGESRFDAIPNPCFRNVDPEVLLKERSNPVVLGVWKYPWSFVSASFRNRPSAESSAPLAQSVSAASTNRSSK